MTLAQTIEAIEMVAMQQPSVNMIVRNDVFRINSAPSLRYGVFAWTQGQHTGNVNGMREYQFTLFYVDRLTEDKGNMTEVQSVGCETIGNILNVLADDYDVEAEAYSLQPFSQRFTDECAGVFANVKLTAPANSLCGEIYDNDDKIIY